MKHAVICGTGKMGIAIGYALNILKYKTSIVETNQTAIDNYYQINGECPSFSHWSQIEKNVDVIISSLPYFVNLDVATWAIDNRIRYCDLGGSVPVSASIKEISDRKATKPVMTDLGLAPGWVNLLAEEVYKLMPCESMTMMVGGIPQTTSDPLNYHLTWSIEGLINEYVDDCEILQDNKKVLVRGMDGLEEVIVEGLPLEAFYTSGALANSLSIMADRNVKNCCYKTLRWRGHCKLMKFLIDAFDRNLESLEKIMRFSSSHYDKDFVIMNVLASKNNVKINKSLFVYPNDKFTAMQRATAFPIVSVADILSDGDLDKIKSPSYADVPLDKFNAILNKLLN
jgi:saccharopine dehydrogenase-like NADP-dependent oxidoreductase